MEKFKNKLSGNSTILLVLVFILVIFSIVQCIYLIRLNKVARQHDVIEKPENGLEKKYGVPDEFFKHFDSKDWDPFEEFQSMRERMDRMFDDSRNRFRSSPFYDAKKHNKGIMPQTNLEEKDDRYIVTMNIPGSEKAEINVDVKDDTLVVSAKTKRNSTDKKGRNYLRMERSMGSFYRSLALPGPIDEGGMATKYEDGVLTIVLPKQK